MASAKPIAEGIRLDNAPASPLDRPSLANSANNPVTSKDTIKISASTVTVISNSRGT